MSGIDEYIQKIKNVAIANNLLSEYKYMGNIVLKYLFPYLLYKKYNLSIPAESLFCYEINPIKITNDASPQLFHDIINYFQNSHHDKSFLMMCIDYLGKDVGHANLLIYDRNTSILEHYEPNGSLSGSEFSFYWEYAKKVVNIIYTNLKNYIPDLKFKSSESLHGFSFTDKNIIGLQTIEGRDNWLGHCQIWCYLVADLVTRFPEYSTETIIRTYLDLDNNKNLSKRDHHREMKKVVRGFYFSSIRMLSKMSEIGNLEPSLFETSDEELFEQIMKLVGSNIYRIFYNKDFIKLYYSCASTVKSYILIFGFERIRNYFANRGSRRYVELIYKKMVSNKDEQFYVDSFTL